MTETDLEHRLPQDVLRERVDHLFGQLPFALISSLTISCGLVGMLWPNGRHDMLLGWLLAVSLLNMGRWLLWRNFRRAQDAVSSPLRWARRYTAMVACSGAFMGAAGVLFFQNQLLTLFALAIVLVVMSIGSIMLHAAYTPAHMAYVLPALLPFALRCLLDAEWVYIMVGMCMLLFLPLNLYLFKRIQHGLIEAIRLRLRNLVLVGELTRQKELAERAKTLAEQANVDKTRFFVAASHDLRQPVQALELFAAALEQELREYKGLQLLTKIRSAGRELSELLNALLDFSKIDAGGVEPAVRDFPVAEMLHRMADDFVPQAASYGRHCRVAGSSAWVRSDPVLLERIVRNLMNNALKYNTPSGKILLGCRRVGTDLRIEVHDSGIGISQHLQKEVFNEFFQLNNPERDRQKGLGLGLAIVDGLARLLAHPLSLRSRPQARFRVRRDGAAGAHGCGGHSHPSRALRPPCACGRHHRRHRPRAPA